MGWRENVLEGFSGRESGGSDASCSILVRHALKAFRAGALFLAGLSSPALSQDLLGVLELSLTSDPEFRAAAADNRAAQEIRSQARSELLPNARLSGSTRWNERQRRSDYRFDQLTLDVEQAIYRRDRRIALDQAGSRVAAADAVYAAARQDLMVRVADRYFAILKAEDEIYFAQATLEAFEQQLALSRERFAVGMLAITDVEEAKAGYDLASAQYIAAENALDIAREALFETTGEYPGKLATLRRMELAMPDPADIEKWTEVAFEGNLRLRAAMHETTTARWEIERIEAEGSATIDVFGSIALHDSESREGENRSANVGLRVTFPLYTGGSTLSRTRESRHRFQAAIETLERTRRQVQRETRSAYLSVDSGISRVRALQQSVRSSETAADEIEAGFQVGTRTSVDVLDAQRDLFRARRDLSEATYTYILNVLRLKRAAGILSEHDLRLVSEWLG